MLKEVDCLPMVKPDAASHLGIRHVYACAFQASSDVGSPHRRWVTFYIPQQGKGDLTWDVREWETRLMPFAGSMFDEARWHTLFVELQWILNTKSDNELRIMKASACRTRVDDGRESGLESSYLVDPASSHMLVSKIKPCMSKYKQIYTVKLRMAH
jgi:hypothetical protein